MSKDEKERVPPEPPKPEGKGAGPGSPKAGAEVKAADAGKPAEHEEHGQDGRATAARGDADKLAAQVADLEDKYQRALAELANVHKRYQRERERLGHGAVAGFVKKLMPVLDNLVHSLKSAAECKDAREVIGGFRLIEKQLLQVFEENGIKAVESVGKAFDPEVHHAVMMEATDKVPPGTVLEEMTRGFVMDGIVIRPAAVKVAAASAPTAGEAENGKEG